MYFTRTFSAGNSLDSGPREEGALGQVEALLVSEGGKAAVDVEAEEAGREALEQMRG